MAERVVSKVLKMNDPGYFEIQADNPDSGLAQNCNHPGKVRTPEHQGFILVLQPRLIIDGDNYYMPWFIAQARQLMPEVIIPILRHFQPLGPGRPFRPCPYQDHQQDSIKKLSLPDSQVGPLTTASIFFKRTV